MRADFELEGAEVVGPIGRVSDALSLVTSSEPPDGAELAINLAGEMVDAVANALRPRNIPFVFLTGYEAGDYPHDLFRGDQVRKPGKPVKIGRVLFSP
jgi:hypothetical protein